MVVEGSVPTISYVEEMSNARWGSSRFCTWTSTISYLTLHISYLHLCEKNKHTILEFSGWTKLEDYSHLNKATFIALPVSSIPTKFSQIWCVVFRNNFKKYCFQLILIFHYFIVVVPPKFIMWSWLCLLIVYDFKC